MTLSRCLLPLLLVACAAASVAALATPFEAVCNSGHSWSFRNVATTSTTTTSTTVTTALQAQDAAVAAQTLCMTAPSGTPSAGAALALSPCADSGSAEQTFSLTLAGTSCSFLPHTNIDNGNNLAEIDNVDDAPTCAALCALNAACQAYTLALKRCFLHPEATGVVKSGYSSGICNTTTPGGKRTFQLQLNGTSLCVAAASSGSPPPLVLAPCQGAAPVFALLGSGMLQDQSTLKCAASAEAAAPPCVGLPGNASAWCDSSLPLAKRVAALVANLTLAEKSSLFVNSASGIPRINWPRYEWWQEALHGVARDGMATSFPQIIGIGSTFNTSLFFQLGDMTSTEARGKSAGMGKTYWAPNVNIFRDPRWGRGQETPGEDPTLTSSYATEFVQGMQGGAQAGDHLKVSACLKHAFAYSEENGRLGFAAVVTKQDMNDTYMPSFKAGVQEGHASGLMCSYNAETYGSGIYGPGSASQQGAIPSCANQYLLADTVRGSWGFDGYITSDCGAVANVEGAHGYTKNSDTTVNAVLQAGMDIDCGHFMSGSVVEQAVKDGTVSESLLDTALTHLFSVQFRLGQVDSPDIDPYANYTMDDVNTPAHQQLAREAADQSMVLLKNNDNTLPLAAAKLKSVAVIGRNANATTTMQGNYYGTTPFLITPLQGVQAHVGSTFYADGTDLGQAVAAAKKADAVVLVIGLDQSDEREGHDRSSLLLPDNQDALVAQVAEAVQVPVVVVIMSGGPLDVSAIKNSSRVGAIIFCGYPGQAGGQAIADALFGVTNRFGKLSMTWYPENFTAQAAMTDFRMRPNASDGYPGRTHRFYVGPTVFPFGAGLSYTRFAKTLSGEGLELLAPTSLAEPVLRVPVRVANVGTREGDAVTLLFAAPPADAVADHGAPRQQLLAFERTRLAAGQSAEVLMAVRLDRLAHADASGRLRVPGGAWTLWADQSGDSNRLTVELPEMLL